MKLTPGARSKHLIRGYSSGEVRVNDQAIRHNCLISPDQILDWRVTHQLSATDVQPIIAMNPEVVILGLTDMQLQPNATIHAAFLERGIGFEVMDIGAACRTFNILLGEERRVTAALLLATD